MKKRTAPSRIRQSNAVAKAHRENPRDNGRDKGSGGDQAPRSLCSTKRTEKSGQIEQGELDEEQKKPGKQTHQKRARRTQYAEDICPRSPSRDKVQEVGYEAQEDK